MAQLVLKDIDTETAEKLDLRAKRLGTTPEEEASRLLREGLHAEPLHNVVTTRENRSAIVQEFEALDPEERAAILKAIGNLQEELAKAKKYVKKSQEIEQPFAAPRLIAEREKEGALMDLLLRMPNVGEDADFERPVDYGRPVVEFD